MRLRLPLLIFIVVYTYVVVNPNYFFLVPNFIYGETTTKLISVNKLFKIKPTEVRLLSAEIEPDSLVFVGDVMLARNVEYLSDKKGCDYPYSNFNLGFNNINPVVVGNFEGAIPELHQSTPDLGLKFSVKVDCVPFLKEAGFSHMSLANNHSYDFGKTGFDNSKKVLFENNINPFGSGNFDKESVTFIQFQDTKVAIIAVQLLSDIPSSDDIKEVFDYANSNSQKQIIYVHWGDEYKEIHNTNQRKWAEEFIEMGADLIVGHHPHVVQDIDIIDNVPVFYSLGNYIFDQYFSAQVKQGLVLRVDFDNDKTINLLPVSSENSLSSPSLMGESAHQKFLSNLSQVSHPDLKDQIISGTILWYSEVATSPKVAMMTK